MTYAFLDTASLLLEFCLFYVFVHAYLLKCQVYVNNSSNSVLIKCFNFCCKRKLLIWSLLLQFLWSLGLCFCKSFWSYVFQVIFYCHELDFVALCGLVFLYVKGSEVIFFLPTVPSIQFSLVLRQCNMNIPQAILGMDVIWQEKSRMGKTAVFVLLTLQQIKPVAGQVSAIVLCHTRELAYQV